VAATTHYEGLKALALADARFVNASVGFDLATMTPTFQLAMGVPGSSSALAVARRFGMPGTVIERAERFLTREDQNFEAVVKKLHDERAALELARAAADEREREARQARVRLDSELEAAQRREKRTLSEEARELMERLRRSRDELRAAQARLRAKRIEPEALREAERAVDRVSREVAIGGALEPLVTKVDESPREPVRAPDLRKGTRVWVPRLRAEAEVVEVMSGGQVRVAAGPLKLTVATSELRAASQPEAPASRPALHAVPRGEPARAPAAGFAGARAPAPGFAGARAPDESPIQTRDNTCDLRGLRVDDGVAMATSFLDRALNEGLRVVFLLHGHGTGALRDAVRKELTRSSYVARFRAAESDQGGEGVTVVWLA
jgi:DNA mismatch repair protein MutS2